MWRVTGAAIIDPTIFTRAIEAVFADPGIGVVAVVNTLPWQPDGARFPGQAFADAIGDGIERAAGPVVYVNQVLEPITSYTKEVMAQARVTHSIPGLPQAVVALRNLAWWSEATRDVPAGVPARPCVLVPEPAA